MRFEGVQLLGWSAHVVQDDCLNDSRLSNHVYESRDCTHSVCATCQQKVIYSGAKCNGQNLAIVSLHLEHRF